MKSLVEVSPHCSLTAHLEEEEEEEEEEKEEKEETGGGGEGANFADKASC